MLEFKIYEDHNLIRSVIEAENSAIITHIVTRKISPANITNDEFEEFVANYSEFSEEYNAWIFTHPDLGEVIYDDENYVKYSEKDVFTKENSYQEFLLEVADFFYDWGVIIKDYSEDLEDCFFFYEDLPDQDTSFRKMIEDQDLNDFIEKNTTLC